MESTVKPVIIIGGGPAALTAAIYTARAQLNPVVIEGYLAGGQLMLTSEVENFPGFPEGILGPELMKRMREQAQRFGAQFITQDVTQVNFRVHPFQIRVDSQLWQSLGVIVATGASAKMLGLPAEKKFLGRGVSTCATCDGAFYKGATVAVVGGGDSAMEEALFLTRYAKKVYVIHRRDTFRASRIMAQRVLNHPNIEVIWNHVVVDILGGLKGVTGVVIQNVQSGQTQNLSVDGLFVAIGHQPNTQLFQGQLELDSLGYIKTQPGSTRTSVEGVFAAGDVQDSIFRQAITAAGSGCMAAIELERWLSEKHSV